MRTGVPDTKLWLTTEWMPSICPFGTSTMIRQYGMLATVECSGVSDAIPVICMTPSRDLLSVTPASGASDPMFTVMKLTSAAILTSGFTRGRLRASRRGAYVGSLQIAAVKTYFQGGQQFCSDHFQLYVLEVTWVFDKRLCSQRARSASVLRLGSTRSLSGSQR